MISRAKQLKLSGFLGAVLVLAFAGLALAASSTTLLGYQIDSLGFVNNGNGTSTWTYAITANGDEARALSHWTLGIGACYDIVSPVNGSGYPTVTSGFGCGSTYNCQASTCTVVHGNDPTTGITGIKFEDCSPQLDGSSPLPRTHIFQFTVDRVPSLGGDVTVGVKPGNEIAKGDIAGPACSPSTVALNDFSASGLPASAGWLLVAALIALGVTGSVITFRRAQLSPGGEK